MLPLLRVCIGIFSITALAFVAGGMNAVYQIERLPLMWVMIYFIIRKSTAKLNKMLSENHKRQSER